MKKKFSIIALIVFLLSGILSPATLAKETTQDLGKKVDWIDINSNSKLVLNGVQVTFQSKKRIAN